MDECLVLTAWQITLKEASIFYESTYSIVNIVDAHKSAWMIGHIGSGLDNVICVENEQVYVSETRNEIQFEIGRNRK